MAGSIPFGQTITDEQLRSALASVPVVPEAARDLPFRVVVPATWKQAPASRASTLRAEEFEMLAAFGPLPDLRLQVLGTLLPWEVNLVDWLEYQAYLKQLQIGELVSRETETGQVVHATGRGADGAWLRIMVAGDGPKVVLLLGRDPAGEGGPDNDVLGLAAASFDFTRHSGQTTREPLKTYRDRDRMFEISHPQSWSTEAIGRYRPQKSAADIRLVSQNDTLAYLRVEADRGVSLDSQGEKSLLQMAHDELADAGLRVTDLEEIPRSGSGTTLRWLGRCILPTGDGQVAILLRPARWWLSAVLVTPAKTVNPYAWMRGKRAFEIAVATLRVPD